MDAWSHFIFLYPVIMSIIWMTGAIYFHFRYEQNIPKNLDLVNFPLVSVMVPARNEEKHLMETIMALLASDYPHFEVIIIDDSSTDGTLSKARQLAADYDKVRLLTLKENSGKAAALNYGLLLTKGEIIVTIDADCLLDKQALSRLTYHFQKYPRVGAVTGNPRVRNRTTLLAKLQAAEYSSVIGLIKRTQRLLGKIMTVSGVIAAFRKRALLDAGLWSTDMITDDIDITWKLEKRFWAVHYELSAIGWILVPETLNGLWNQRLRWAQGGIEVLKRHRNIFSDWRCRRLWPIYLDYVLSIFWAFSFLIFALLWLMYALFGFTLPHAAFTAVPIPEWTGSIAALVCLVQFGISFSLDSKYDKTAFKSYIWLIWYPVIYWAYNSLALVMATPRALLKKRGTQAIWQSPDRGLHDVNRMV